MGAFEKIADVNITSATTSINITGLNITKDDFIMFRAVVNNTGGLDYYGVFPNGSGTLYAAMFSATSSNAISQTRNSRPDIIRAESNQNSNWFATAKLSSNGSFNIFGQSSLNETSDIFIWMKHVTSITTYNNITSFNFTRLGSATYGVGSRIEIYKLTTEKIADITTSSTTSEVEITNLNITKDNEYLLVSDLINGSSASELWLLPDDKTSNQFFHSSVKQSGSSHTVFKTGNPRIGSTSANTRMVGECRIKLANNGALTYQTKNNPRYGTTSNELEINNVTYANQDISTINKLTIKSQVSNQILTGSRFELYKLF
jgi:hypothetical protein